MNRYPSLKQAFNELARGKFENLDVQYIPGMPPTAYFYNAAGSEINSITLNDMDLNSLKELLANNGFVVRRPTLPLPRLATEFALGGVHYQFFGKGELYFAQAQEFAASQTLNGHKGRLLTLQCREQEDALANWINKYAAEQGEAELREQKVWLGVTDQLNEGQFIWTASGEDIGYSHWNGGEPNNAGGDEDCVMLSTSYGWNDVSCEADHAQVVIEYGPTPSTVCLHGDL